MIDALETDYQPIYFSPYDVGFGFNGMPKLEYTVPGVNDQNTSYLALKMSSTTMFTPYAFTQSYSSLLPNTYFSYQDIGQITDVDFVNYIVDKYLWDGVFTQEVLNPFSTKSESQTIVWNDGKGLLNYFNEADKEDITTNFYCQVQALLTKNSPDNDNYDVWDSYEVTNNTAVWPGVTEDDYDYHYAFNFENAKKDDAGNIVFEVFHDESTKAKDLNLVLNDTDPDKSKYFKTDGNGTQYFNVAHYLDKALGPYANPEDEQKTYNQKLFKLMLFLFERWTQIFWEGEQNKHYPLAFSVDNIPINNDDIETVYIWDRHSRFNTNDIIGSFAYTNPTDKEKTIRRSLLRACMRYELFWAYGNHNNSVFPYDYSPFIPQEEDVPYPSTNMGLYFYLTQIQSNDLDNFYLYDTVRYMNKVDVTIFWAFFSFGLFIVVVVVYSKTDFK